MLQRALAFLLLSTGLGLAVEAQDTLSPVIHTEERGDSVRFSATLRPLRQLAGAPSAYYSYFWELGDGRFSFDKDPSYAYRDTGVYQVRLFATNNYDDGKAPPSRPRPIKVRKKGNGPNMWASHFFHGSGDIEMKINRNPKPGENFVALVGYRNRSADTLGGSIVLFYNERQVGHKGFDLADERAYNGEQASSLSALTAALPVQGVGADIAVLRGAAEGSAEAQLGSAVGSAAAVALQGLAVGNSDEVDARGSAAGEADPMRRTAFTDPGMGPYDPLAEATMTRAEATMTGAELKMTSAETTTTGAGGADYKSQSLSLLHLFENQFTQHTVLRFPAIRQGEEKFLFLEMNTLPEMIRDTNATVSLIAMMVPDQAGVPPEVYELDMQIVASHDPNRMQLVHRRINYRFMKSHKELRYRINFQNTGKGPTRKIAIGVRIPPELNGQSIQLTGMSPWCPWCDSVYQGHSCLDSFRRADSVYFVLNNIYLPGLQQGVVGDQDSTKGFVEFSIRFKRKPKKIPFSTRAAITFDGNTPLVTNNATARFIKGISPGIMVGYNYLPSQGTYSAQGPVQIGYVLAPYSPYRPYFQAEVSLTALEQEKDAGVVVKFSQDTSILGKIYVITGRQSQTTTKRNSVEVTPLHFRYNLSNWVGVGIGATAQISLSEQTTTENKTYFESQLPPFSISSSSISIRSSTRWIGDWKAEPFVDIQVGRVRTGPVIGLRYLRPLQGNLTDRFFLYAGFKL